MAATNRPETFRVGMIVYLNSGGPRMTVEEILSGSNLVRVAWLDAINKLQRAELPAVCITTTETHRRDEDVVS